MAGARFRLPEPATFVMLLSVVAALGFCYQAGPPCSTGAAWNLPRGSDVIEGMAFESFVEEIQVLGHDLVEKVRELIHEGNVQRIVVKDEHGNTFVEIPVTLAAVGAILAPLLAAIGAISALVAKFTIVVVRSEPKPPGGGQPVP